MFSVTLALDIVTLFVSRVARRTVTTAAVLLGTSLRSGVLDPVGEMGKGMHAMSGSLFPVTALLTVALCFIYHGFKNTMASRVSTYSRNKLHLPFFS